MTIEKLKDKLHDKIEIYVCEVEENTLIAQGMLKALGMMDEVLDNAEQEPCNGNECKYYKAFADVYFHTDPDKYAEQEPTIPCDLCIFGSRYGDNKYCEYFGECPARAKGW